MPTRAWWKARPSTSKRIPETDRFGRILRYVFTPDGFVNAELVKGGLPGVDFPPDVKYEQYLRGLEQEARTASRGLWGPACKQATSPPPAQAPTPTPKPQSTGQGKSYRTVYFDGGKSTGRRAMNTRW